MKKLFGILLCFVLSAAGAFAASYNTSTNWFDTKNVSHLNTIGQNIIKANKKKPKINFLAFFKKIFVKKE